MAAENVQRFRAQLLADGEGGAWVVLPIPFDVESAFGARGRVSVCGTLNGASFRNSIFPNGNGTHHMMVNKQLQRDAGTGPDAEVDVVIQLDTASRAEKIPSDFARALAVSAQAANLFREFSDSSKNEFIRWIDSAKQKETREARVKKAVERIEAGKKRVSG